MAGKLTEAVEPVSGRYTDLNGRRWYCAKRAEWFVCHSDDGHMTVADFATFRKWGWAIDDGRTALEDKHG